jgi:hypothetical protein
MESTSEIYESAIGKLQNYVDNEPDKQKRDKATNQIQQLRLAMQELAFKAMTERTNRLVELKDALQSIIDAAGDDSGASGAIADLVDFVENISI